MLAQSSRHTPCAARVQITHRQRPRGFTLIEMLIAMVLTLIMVWAIAEFYARVGEAVKDGRAMIDQRNGLRTVTQRLHEDLSLHTAVPAPPVHDEVTPIVSTATTMLMAVQGGGYIAASEGICSDADPDGNGIDANGNNIADIAEDIVPAPNGNGVPDYLENTSVPWTNCLGDIDDYIGFTIRSAGEPFTAQVVFANPSDGTMSGTGVGTANLAEVAWWTSFKDDPLLASLGVSEPAESRTLHRRLLLIRPEANIVHGGDNDYVDAGGNHLPYYFRVPNSPLANYYDIMQICDVSVRPINPNNPINGFIYYWANSLADLTRRENRFLHVGTAFPHAIDLNPNNFGNEALARGHIGNILSQYRWVLWVARRGEDVILSNVLAFDVRLFDATAVLRGNNSVAANVTGTLQPGDPGYKLAVDNNYPIAGQGAYVDLWYNRYVLPVVPANSASAFSGPPQFKSQLPGAVYCTWAASYERDGLNQDYASDAVADINTPPFDEGTDGIDSDTFNGVDDQGEHETSPPYPVRLRGLEVKVRTYEPGTRQVQQGTVSSDFIPE